MGVKNVGETFTSGLYTTSTNVFLGIIVHFFIYYMLIFFLVTLMLLLIFL